MNLNFRNLKNYQVKFVLLLVFVFGLIGCSGSAKRSASPFFLENIAKFDGKFSVYISDKKLINNSKIESQDCESWQIEIELDKAYRESLNNIIHRMFNNVEFTDKELNEDEENYKFTPMVGIYPLDTTGKEYRYERTDKAKQKMWVNAINKAIQDGTYDKRCAEIDKLKEAAAEKTKATNDLINPIKKKYALKRKSLDKRESIPLKSGGPRKRAIAKAPEEYHAQVEELENAEEDEIAKVKVEQVKLRGKK